MKRLLMIGALILAALPSVAGAEETVKTGTRGGKPYFETSSVVTRQAKVIGIDAASRNLTLRGEKGDTLHIKVGEHVKNFAQIKKGDQIKITYTESFTVHVEAPGTPELVSEKTMASAKPGETPSGGVTERTKYKATITAIDKKNGTVTLKGYEGEEFVMTPLHPENLDKVAVGELVVFTQTQAVAGSVEKSTPKKKAK